MCALRIITPQIRIIREHVRMSRDQEGQTKDRGVKEKGEKGREDGRTSSSISAVPTGSTDATKAIFISCFPSGRSLEAPRAHLIAQIGLSRGV